VQVFAIVAVQLAVTVGFSLMCIYVEPLNTYLRANAWPFWSAWISALVFLIVLSCVPTLRRKFPVNMICLAVFTILEAWCVGMSCRA